MSTLVDQAENSDSAYSDSPESDSTPSLSDRICENFVSSVFDINPRDFLPHDCLVELITEAVIIHEMELPPLERNRDKELVMFILRNSKRVFATAAMCGIYGNRLLKIMKKFKDHGFDDDCLPVREEKVSGLPCFSGRHWSAFRVRSFLENQWAFLAPVFSKSNFKLDLDPKHILPFTWVSNEAKDGTFSQVYQVKIHPSHQEAPDLNVSRGFKHSLADSYL